MSRKLAARQDPSWMVVFKSPDSCKTPPSMAPVPYPVTANLGQSLGNVSSVLLNGCPAVVFDQSKTPMTLGDQAGVGLGVESNIVMGICSPKTKSGTVFFGNKPMVRKDDEFHMNGKQAGEGNTTGTVQAMAPPMDVPALAANPALRPEILAERPTADRTDRMKKGKITRVASLNVPALPPLKGTGSDGGDVAGKGKLGCGESGTYGDLQKKTSKGKYDRDHIPSKESLLKRAEKLNGSLTTAEKSAIISAAEAIAIPKSAHQSVSPTYGGRNNPDLVKWDADHPVEAAHDDTEKMLKDLDKHGADEKCKEAYRKAAQKIRNMSEDDYNKLIDDAIASVG